MPPFPSPHLRDVRTGRREGGALVHAKGSRRAAQIKVLWPRTNATKEALSAETAAYDILQIVRQIRRNPRHSIRKQSRCSPKISSTPFFVEMCARARPRPRTGTIVIARCIWFVGHCAQCIHFRVRLRFSRIEWNFRQTQHKHCNRLISQTCACNLGADLAHIRMRTMRLLLFSPKWYLFGLPGQFLRKSYVIIHNKRLLSDCGPLCLVFKGQRSISHPVNSHSLSHPEMFV